MILECCAMKVLRFLLILLTAMVVGFSSWSYYSSRLLQEKHERALLVFEGYYNKNETYDLERYLCL
jgi:hypothetical protein